MKIQFLLLSDGPSHKLLGVNPVNGLRKIGISAEYLFCNRKKGSLLSDPDYVFCLKPRENDFLALEYKNKKSKLVLILNDEQLPLERTRIYDFAVSPSLTWKKNWEKTQNSPCFLIKEEFDYFVFKNHCKEDIKVVSVGYSENLKKHLKYISEIADSFDFTIISEKRIKEFKNANFVKFQPDHTNYFEKNYDQQEIEQFQDFNVGLVTQDGSGRTSNRLKLLLYAGLPVICSDTENFSDLWFDKTEIKVKKFSSNIVGEIESLRNVEIRQEITDFNYKQIQQKSGIEISAKSFLEAISLFERNTNA